MCVLIAGLLLTSPVAHAAEQKAAPEQKKTETDDQKSLYALGVIMSRNLAVFGLNAAELEIVKRGLTDGVLERKLEIEGETLTDRVDSFAEARMKAQAEKEKAAAKEFLDAAAQAKGAVKTDSGLIITPIAEGSGESPKATDTVKVNYHGTLRDGTVFDSSVQRGTPATIPLNRVIPCWTEGVQKMKVGGRSKLVCPSSIAYGDSGRPPTIKPGAPLVFEVELIEIMPAAPAAKLPPEHP
jgi:FKBP-type peptidyl-prolyl cis-trans isomerase FkpA/FKBP-type peptidyl-prolyl cis-trans isomerase FklB